MPPATIVPQDALISPANKINSDGRDDISQLVDHTDDTLLGKEDLVRMVFYIFVIVLYWA